MQTETIELVAEEVKETPKNELAIAGEKISEGLASFNQKRADLTKLAEEAKAIKIEGVEDKAGIKLADAKRKELKAERVAITNLGKEMRSRITIVSKGIIEKEKELTSIISGEEQRLVDDLDKIEQEKERIKQEAIKAEELRIQTRIDSLAEYGFAIDLADIKSMSDETFGQYKEAAKVQFEKEQAEKAEAERLEAERIENERLAKEAEAKKLAAERKELEELRKIHADAQRIIDEKNTEAQRLIDEKNAEIERENKRISDERLKMQQDKENARTRMVASLGIPFNFTENAYIEQDICVPVLDIKTLNDLEWDGLMNSVSERKIAIDLERKAMDAKILEEAKKKAAADALQAEKEAKEREAEEARVKADQLPDKKKINEYIKSIQSLEVPVMKSANGKKIMTSIQELVGKLTSYSTEKANTL